MGVCLILLNFMLCYVMLYTRCSIYAVARKKVLTPMEGVENSMGCLSPRF